MAEETDTPAVTPEKYDAIHRALLTGLLGNIGFKSDPHEYAGAQGTKFYIFPGSGQFRKEPKWIVAAEVVETTRLYARTVARIQPEWIERLARHLVKRTYSEPRWQETSAHVIANEKVTLHGLVIVPQRTVHYGPIDPKLSRELFIHHALVEGEYHSEAPFFKHNAKLIEEIELLEAKVRQRDVLVDTTARYAFYEARVPEGIYNGPLFEKWRKQAERENARLLYMSRSDLMARGAEEITAQLFPDALTIGGMRLPVEYHLDPGGKADGVTVTVPLVAVNQLPAERFEWLVPGMLREKIVALLRTLPKSIRTNFIPTAEFADKAAAAMPFAEGTLLEALSRVLGKLAGLNIPRDAWQPAALSDHLRMNFRVLDDRGKTVAEGRDLTELRRTVGAAAKSTFAAAPTAEFHRDGITRWDFDDLPEQIEVKRHGMTLAGYPAIVDAGTSVSLRVLDSPDAARLAMRGGLRRLFLLQTRDGMRQVTRPITALERGGLIFVTLGTAAELREQVMAAIAEQAFFADGGDVRTREEFVRRAELGWRRLGPAANEIGTIVEETLASYGVVARGLERAFPAMLAPAAKDMKEQLAHLMSKDFLLRTPGEWRQHLPRFLNGIEARLKKLMNAGLARDQQHMAVVRPLWERYLQRAQKHRDRGVADPALTQYRWLLEELRVSLFAQELKTSTPVSPKRLETIWSAVQG